MKNSFFAKNKKNKTTAFVVGTDGVKYDLAEIERKLYCTDVPHCGGFTPHGCADFFATDALRGYESAKSSQRDEKQWSICHSNGFFRAGKR